MNGDLVHPARRRTKKVLTWGGIIAAAMTALGVLVERGVFSAFAASDRSSAHAEMRAEWQLSDDHLKRRTDDILMMLNALREDSKAIRESQVEQQKALWGLQQMLLEHHRR